MTEYVVLLPGDESQWERTSQADKEAMYAIHREFAQALETRGHKVTVEQVGGFYVVDLPSWEAALETARLLPLPAVEVRPLLEVEA